MTIQVLQYLNHLHVPVSHTYVRKRMESHPNYPSLLSIHDTLQELGIESYACEGTKEELLKETSPVLLHFNIGDGHLQYFKSPQQAVKEYAGFDKKWSGHAMFITLPPQQLRAVAVHDALLRQEKQRRFFETGLFVLLACAPVITTVVAGNFPALLISIFSIGGLYLSWLIAQKELGLSNEVSNMLCSMVKNSRCEAVILSRGGRLFRFLSWGDVGLVYFTTTLLFIALGTILPQHNFMAWQYTLCLAGLVFPFYSIYYQWRMVKQWCVLCLGVVAALLLSGLTALYTLAPIHTAGMVEQLHGQSLLCYGVMILIVFTTWQLWKQSMQQAIKSLPHEINALRLKRNPDIFKALLNSKDSNSYNLPWVDEPIVYGNPQAPYKIVVACNPYCGPCAKAHKQLDHIFEAHPHHLQVAIRFSLHKVTEENEMIVAAKKILAAAKDKPMQAINDWYEYRDIEKYAALHPTETSNVEDALKKHAGWVEQAGIKGTPTFFINGRELPQVYNWMEFLTLLEYELDNHGSPL